MPSNCAASLHYRRTRAFIVAVGAGLILCYVHEPLVAQAQAPDKTFDVAAEAAFKDHALVVRRFAAQRRPAMTGTFCVVGFVTADGAKLAWVVSPGVKELVLWEPGETVLARSRRWIRLPRDVVDSEDQLQGSTYRVTRAWVERITDTCERTGIKVPVAAPKADRR